MIRRLAFVSSNFPQRSVPNQGLFLYETAKALARRVQLRVFCPVATYPKVSPLQPRTYRNGQPDLAFCPEGTETEYLPYPALPMLSRALNYATILRRLTGRLRAFRPEAVLGYWIYPDGLAAALAARELGVPVILGSRGSDLHSIPGPIVRHLTRRALCLASRVVTVSEDLRARVIDFGVLPDRVRTIRNGCDTAIFHPRPQTASRLLLGIKPECRLIVFVGRFQPVKGLPDLIDAFVRIAPADPRLELALVGDGRLQPRLETSVARRGLSSRIHFPGACAPDQVAVWLSASDALCLASHMEGCPNVVLEALSCGRPVVATRVGGIPEMLSPDNSILVPPNDSAAMAEALVAVLGRPWDPDAVARCSTRGWDTVADETLDVCESAMRDHAVDGRKE